jgi:hypothetical protein
MAFTKEIRDIMDLAARVSTAEKFARESQEREDQLVRTLNKIELALAATDLDSYEKITRALAIIDRERPK